MSTQDWLSAEKPTKASFKEDEEIEKNSKDK